MFSQRRANKDGKVLYQCVRLFLNADLEATSGFLAALFTRLAGPPLNLDPGDRLNKCAIYLLRMLFNLETSSLLESSFRVSPLEVSRSFYTLMLWPFCIQKMKRRTKAGVKLVSVFNGKSFRLEFARLFPAKRAL